MDPIGSAGSNSTTAHALCAGVTNAWYRTDFYPTQLASAVMVNRADGGLATRMTAGSANLSIVTQTGATALFARLTADNIQQFTLAAFDPPFYPDGSTPDQASGTARATRVRYVQISARAGGIISLRELFVLDSTTRNVAFGKPVALSMPASAGNAGSVVDGVLDFDSPDAGSSQLLLNASGTSHAPFLVVDLGGLFDVTHVINFNNRFAMPGGGYTIELLNWDSATIANFTSPPLAQVGTVVVAGRTYAALASPSNSQTLSQTPSNSPTASATGTPSSSTTATPSNTPTGACLSLRDWGTHRHSLGAQSAR